ncbi:MAG: Zn-ribbon domain-containing OB-fold protein [Thermodesulfobacteriota bacterium]|nr:Zn-ribbon domain-containing OB-fold protein [Thermodesulfobacteriota bacterium]
MVYKKPLPKPNSDTRPFWNGCRDHELRFQRCKECGHVRWPPSIICPRCYSTETEWVVSNGKGRIYSFVVYHVAFHPAFKDEVPYVTAIVELPEGPHLLTNIVECDTLEVKCDMPVEVVWEDINEEFSLPKFKPTSGN